MNSKQANTEVLSPKTKLTFRLMHHGEIAMGPGKAELLLAILQTGSISAAGKSMQMSYRRAWMLVDVMNRCFKEPLVLTAKGGKDGGGATLTPLGLQVLESYQAVVQAINHTVQAYTPLFSGLMADLPPEENHYQDSLDPIATNAVLCRDEKEQQQSLNQE
ncbi:molybdenum transport protein [Methylomonas sp. AM2-LC]|uniref:winged helix-turn-helix domain-containing protein n=1 Tax=Methylomonas sp. AM2-LC TaxID=3153301 RepID=UPI0032636B50